MNKRSQRKERLDRLQSIIENMDAGVLQVHIYKGMPVKVRIVGREVMLDGDTMLDLGESEAFVPRKWWDNKPLDETD
jgi:hypothetical protein